MGVGGQEVIAQLAAHARRFAESGGVPAVPRVAATVLLVRPGDAGFEVYLLRRRTNLAFAGGMYAFPGGAVDPADRTGAPVPGGWGRRLGRPEPEAAAVLRAAVREVAEETGVRLDVASLVPWARWLTPEFEPRRYDTYFFLAPLPAGQRPAEPAADDGEADLAVWRRPAEAVADAEADRLPMLPPTRYVLRDLAGYDSVEAALAAGAERELAAPVFPRIVHDPDGTPRLVL